MLLKLPYKRSINGHSDGLIHAVDFIGDSEILTIQLKSGTLMQAKVEAGQDWSLSDPVTLGLNRFRLFPNDNAKQPLEH